MKGMQNMGQHCTQLLLSEVSVWSPVVLTFLMVVFKLKSVSATALVAIWQLLQFIIAITTHYVVTTHGIFHLVV